MYSTLNGFLTVQSAWTGPPAPALFAYTGWDTCPASLALLASFALKVLLYTTQRVKSCKEVGHLTKSVGHTQKTRVINLTSVMLKKPSDKFCQFIKIHRKAFIDNK